VTRREGEFLRVASIGGIDARVLPGQLVTVHGRQDLPAVMALPPAFLLPKAKRDSVAPLGELLVDTGLPADRLGALVAIGDLVSFAQPPVELLNDQLAAKSLDNRASVAALSVCLEVLQGRPHAWDVLAVATVQEEIGLRGAGTSAFSLQPDLAVAVDVTYGSDSNTREFSHRTLPLGGGPALGLGPNIHSGLHAAFKACAERAEIPYTVEVMPGHSGTDAFAIQVAREGIPTMVVSIPLRSMHTPVEVVAIKDIARAGRLLAEFAVSLNGDFLKSLTLD
jgi:tetrahedral aminopeptidase